jgi:signal transduction histidine kinase
MTTLPGFLLRVSEPISTELKQDIDRAFEHERDEAVSSGAAVRSVGSLVIVAILGLAWLATGKTGWWVYLGPLTMYAAVATTVFLFRRHPLVRGAGGMIGVLDVLVVAGVQLRNLPVSNRPDGVAGFSLGLFALLIVLNTVTFSGRIIYLIAAASCVAQLAIMHAAGIETASMIVAVVVLLLEASVLSVVSGRLRKILNGLANAEVERRFEQRKVAEIEESKRTIETMLGDSRHQNERLRQLQFDKDRLTQLLVHDMRSPLTVITGTADLVEMRLAEPAIAGDMAEDIEAIRSTAMRLSGMINDILGIAKMEDGQLELHRERLSITQLVGTVAEQTRRASVSRHIVVQSSTEDDIFIDGDPSLIRRVLENLLSNGARYTPQGGSLRLSAKREGNTAVLSIQNHGTPIDPELRTRLFEKYQQAKSTRGGWGLGLYFCRLALEAHGGTIAIEDVPSWATTFVLRVPLAPAP